MRIWLREKEPEIPLLPVADTPATLRAVALGDAFAFVGNIAATSYIGDSGLTEIKVLGGTSFVVRMQGRELKGQPRHAYINAVGSHSQRMTRNRGLLQKWATPPA